MWCRLRAGEWAPAASPHRIKSTRPVEVDILLGQPCPTLAEGLIHVHRHSPQQLGFRHLAAAAAQRHLSICARLGCRCAGVSTGPWPEAPSERYLGILPAQRPSRVGNHDHPSEPPNVLTVPSVHFAILHPACPLGIARLSQW